ncbi:hypothetical protein QM012_005368 [Aureobasidium pullulans]|uniref:Uncharacterized protein n=1 Tax=Aureobasidium pullulans TaxID=5580 RepID=A0ABR0T648_AURPU
MDPTDRRLSASPTVISRRPGKEYASMTSGQHAAAFGESRVSLLDVIKKARPHDATTQALEERTRRTPRMRVPADQSMKGFTEEDWYRVRESAFSIPEPAPERRRREQISARDQRAQRRSKEKQAERREGVRRSGRHSSAKAAFAEAASQSPSSDSSEGLFVSPASDSFSPPFRRIKRKRAVAFKATDDKMAKPTTRRRRRILSNSDEDMTDATASRSRSVTPVPPIKRYSKRRTTLADSDDEMAEPSASPVRSATPEPPIKKHGKRRTTLVDSDDEMGEASVSRARSVTPLPAIKRRKIEGKRRVTIADSDDEME